MGTDVWEGEQCALLLRRYIFLGFFSSFSLLCKLFLEFGMCWIVSLLEILSLFGRIGLGSVNFLVE